MIGGADSEKAQEESPSAATTALATGAAIVPGVLLHGSGLYVAGDTRGASRLLAIEGMGLGLLVAGGVPLGLSGASRRLTWPAVPMVVSGLGLFTVSWLADIYGASGLSEVSGAAPRPAPMEFDLGYAYVRDVHFAYDHFSVASARLRWDRVGIEPTAWIAVGADNQRLRLRSSYRLIGATPTQLLDDGSYLDVAGAATFHRYGDEGFDTRLAELEIAGRLDLLHLSPRLRGSYIELSTGFGLEWFHYQIAGTAPRVQDDVFSLLLGRFSLGMRLGEPGGVFGELELGYDHRRDDFAAGFSTAVSGSGFGGHFGASGELFLGDAWPSWGVRTEVWFGGAHVYRLSLVRRLGGLW